MNFFFLLFHLIKTWYFFPNEFKKKNPLQLVSSINEYQFKFFPRLIKKIDPSVIKKKFFNFPPGGTHGVNRTR